MGSPFCILLREDNFKEFAAELAERPDSVSDRTI
jgi:hypothetical protein